MHAIEVIRSNLAAGGAHLGDIVWWALSDARIDRQRLESVWTGAGLDAGLLPEEPTPEKAFRTAVRETQVGQAELLLRLGKEDAGEIIFAVVREHRTGDGSVAYHQEARITLDRGLSLVRSDTPGHELFAAVKAKYEVYRTTHTVDDVRRAVTRALESWAAVTLRESGGVYWVPAPYSKQVRQLQVAVEHIGSSRLHLVPVHRTVEAERTLGEVASASIEAELAALKTEVEGFLAAPPDRTSTLERRLEAFETLRGKALLYHAVLGTQVNEVEDQLTRLVGSVATMLATKKAA